VRPQAASSLPSAAGSVRRPSPRERSPFPLGEEKAKRIPKSVKMAFFFLPGLGARRLLSVKNLSGNPRPRFCDHCWLIFLIFPGFYGEKGFSLPGLRVLGSAAARGRTPRPSLAARTENGAQVLT